MKSRPSRGLFSARALPPAIALIAVLITVALLAPAFFSSANLGDLALNNAPVLIVAIGMTCVILVGEIDISVGSQFAVCSVAAGVLAKAGVPIMLVPIATLLIGATMGALNGALVGFVGLPSIIVTLAMLVTWRDALRWSTEGAWIQNLPDTFQWFGSNPFTARFGIVAIALIFTAVATWCTTWLHAGRRLYAVGSDAEAARLNGIEPRTVRFSVFTLMGALVGVAAALNAVRFTSIPSNAGIGLELQTIAAVVVGGTAITGGRGSIIGTLIGVLLLGSIGTAMTYLGINPFWTRAVQGTIILVALVTDALFVRYATHATRHGRARAVAR